MVESKSPPGPHFPSSTSIMLIFGCFFFFLSETFQQLLDGCTSNLLCITLVTIRPSLALSPRPNACETFESEK